VIFSTDEFNDSRLDSETRQPLWKWQSSDWKFDIEKVNFIN